MEIGISEFEKVIRDLEQNLYLPKTLRRYEIIESNRELLGGAPNTQKNYGYKIEYGIVQAPVHLSCGCIVSRKIRNKYVQDPAVRIFYSNRTGKPNNTLKNKTDVCPVCHGETNMEKIAVVKPLVNIYNQLQFIKNKYNIMTNNGNESDDGDEYLETGGSAYKSQDVNYSELNDKTNGHMHGSKISPHSAADKSEYNFKDTTSSSNKQSLISLFHSIALNMADTSTEENEIVQPDTNNATSQTTSNNKNSKSVTKVKKTSFDSGSFTKNTEIVAGEIFDDSVSKTKTLSLKEDKSALTNFDEHQEKNNMVMPQLPELTVQADAFENNELLPSVETQKETENFSPNTHDTTENENLFNSSNSEKETAHLTRGPGQFNTPLFQINHNIQMQQQEAMSKVNTPLSYNETDENKEYYYAKCFPMYRKKYQFNTHSKFLKTKSKLFINTEISPDCTKFALITEHKWEVYSFGENNQPKLLCCGKVTGEFGPDFDHLVMPSNLNQVIPTENCENINNTHVTQNTKYNPFKPDWDHLYCKLSSNLLVIAGTKGVLRVIDIGQGMGRPVCTFKSKFPIRCIDIDYNTNVIACGITGKDRNSGAEQALIVFHRVVTKSVAKFDNDTKTNFFPHFSMLSPITITLPYRDPINTLQFSQDGHYLSCSTCFESRFLVISTRKINEPRLVMKSIRSIDTSLESEGITDTKIFPGNSNLMCVTAVAFNAPPIVINTKIQSISMASTHHVAQPTMLLRLDELGSKIYKCEISPRNDSIAFLDRNGSVYIMTSPTMADNEKRRIVTVEMCSNAYRLREAASLRFSSDGHKLYILDRKGVFYVEDFAAGLPQSHFVTKCKQIN